MEKLAEYLEGQGWGAASSLADACGTDPATITRLKQGKQTPTLKLAFAIEKATHGAVPAGCWIGQQAAE